MDNKLRDIKEIGKRKEFIEKLTHTSLSSLSIYPEKLKDASETNCENMIGAVSVPLGVAGPVKISGNFAKGEYYIPLATTEAALVASVNRGCKGITLSKQSGVYSRNSYITRGAVYRISSIKEGFEIISKIESQISVLEKIVSQNSKHTKFMGVKPQIIGRKLFMRYLFDTSDAMGMNMVTIASQKISDYLMKNFNLTCISLAGNYDIDKKPSWLNFISGRGKTIWAEAFIGREVVKSVFKTEPEKIVDVCLAKCHLGSEISGSMGFNAHFANILSAVFIACGQDPAHVSESSIGITDAELVEGDLYISIYLPDLPIGVLGGGTSLPAQKECLSIIGLKCQKEGEKVMEFAEVIATAVLAGELSLLSSLAQGSLANAHINLSGRKQ